MRKLLLLAAFACIFITSFGQTDSLKGVKPDDLFTEVFKTEDLYRYSKFMNGKVVFRDGSETAAQLNYHKVFDEFMFIDQKGDSLAIGNGETIRVIVINKDSFYFTKGSFIESIGRFKDIVLAKKQLFTEVDQEKKGAYGQTYSNNATTSRRFYYTIDGKPRLNVGEKTIFGISTEYFIAYKSDEFIPASKKNIEKLFSNHSREVRDFLKENQTNFKSEHSVKQLVEYLAKL
jgi:hypothetical protein